MAAEIRSTKIEHQGITDKMKAVTIIGVIIDSAALGTWLLLYARKDKSECILNVTSTLNPRFNVLMVGMNQCPLMPQRQERLRYLKGPHPLVSASFIHSSTYLMGLSVYNFHS